MEKALMAKFHSLISLAKMQEDASLLVFFYEKYSQQGRVSEPCIEISCWAIWDCVDTVIRVAVTSSLQ